MSRLLKCLAECRYAEGHYAECRYAERHYAECHDYLNVMLSFIMLSVVAPFLGSLRYMSLCSVLCLVSLC